MIYIRKYTIHPTNTFKEELENIIKYMKYKLKEPIIAKRFYKSIVNELNSLEYLPERNKKIESFNYKERNIRKLLFKNYIIIYEVNNNKNQVFILHIFHTSQNYFNLI